MVSASGPCMASTWPALCAFGGAVIPAGHRGFLRMDAADVAAPVSQIVELDTKLRLVRGAETEREAQGVCAGASGLFQDGRGVRHGPGSCICISGHMQTMPEGCLKCRSADACVAGLGTEEQGCKRFWKTHERAFLCLAVRHPLRQEGCGPLHPGTCSCKLRGVDSLSLSCVTLGSHYSCRIGRLKFCR